MSLSRLAAQLCAVQALRGRTLVGDNVRDSETGIIQIDADGSIATSLDRPFVNVFCDDTLAADTLRRDLWGGGRLTMSFEFGVTAAMPLVTPDGRYLIDSETDQIATAARAKPSDAQINILVELVERQIRACLMDPGNPWAELWREFMTGNYRVESLRGASDKDGLRFGARRLRVTADLLPDLPSGSPIAATSTWRRFLDALPGSQIETIAVEFAAMLGGADHEDALDALRRRYGLTRDEAGALLDRPQDAAGVAAAAPGLVIETDRT
ncbi:hypothetical protein NPA31_007185 [Aurantimonas sp. MSK8Z-1]|uniref:hypothetical protein n=1 Tax=Mangrovibrevibacter kandeliae TaxID=2968473 RepID=UPI002118213B|nr:hypothetical protein [Aurantimonas sp. MSK8Z-1]MCW4114745.1 hypothetical protein [Aurantimonas sp. MSK8Z-1]